MASVPFPVGFAGELLTTSNLPWHGTVAAWVQGIVRCGGGGEGGRKGAGRRRCQPRVYRDESQVSSLAQGVCGGFQVRQERRAGT